MILILCSVSDKQPNDSVANGLVHFLLKAKFQNAEYINAVFHRESRRMELIRKGHANSRVAPMEGMERSMRLSCVSRLLAMMNTGDQLWVCKLSDLADNAEDACTLYFSFLKKGIELKFFVSVNRTATCWRLPKTISWREAKEKDHGKRYSYS